MAVSNTKRNIVLGILFFLPVAFLLMLYPAKHNYIPLDIVHKNVSELNGFQFEEDTIQLKEHITVLGFLGKQPLKNAVSASNLKELVYDKFKGFKKFQVVIVVPDGTSEAISELKKEINTYEDLRFWHYVYGSESDVNRLYNSLKSSIALDDNLFTPNVFIIDKDLNQRGRLDAREDKEKESNKLKISLLDYNCIDVGTIKNKMSDDMRILFTEYRQKRKGKFDSTSRRADDIKIDNE